MKKILLFIVFVSILFISYGQVSKTNSNTGTITNVLPTVAQLDRTFSFTSREFTSTSLTEVEISIQLILGNGTPPNPGAYGVH